MRGLFEGARTIKPGQKWLRELFKGAVFSRARSDQGNTVRTIVRLSIRIIISCISCLFLLHFVLPSQVVNEVYNYVEHFLRIPWMDYQRKFEEAVKCHPQLEVDKIRLVCACF